MRTRRDFLGMSAGTLAAVALPSRALAAATWDVSYLWSRTLAAVLAHRARVAPLLGAAAKDLVVGRGNGGLWGLLLDVDQDEPGAEALAAAHDALLRAALGTAEPQALPLRSSAYATTHHLRYAIVEDEGAAKVVRGHVAKKIDAELGASLVLEPTADGRKQLMFKCFATDAEAQAMAADHSGRLATVGIAVTPVVDRFLPTNAPPKIIVAAKPKPVAEQNGDPDDLPAAVATPLRDAINAYIQGLRKQGTVEPDEATSWYVHTLHDDRTWVAINAATPRQCASMVKPYVALAFFHRVKEGRIRYGSTSRSKLEGMIQRSDNNATNWAMDLVGGPDAVQGLLSQHYGHLLRETSIVEDIPTDGRTYRNRSSARDYVRFARALWRDQIPYSHEIKRLMALPGRDRLFTGAPAIPSGTQVMNKTGTTSQLCGDFGILVARGANGKPVPYAFVGIIEKNHQASTFSRWVAARGSVIRSVSNLTYRLLDDHYRLT